MSVKEVEVTPLGALPQGCSDEGLLSLEGYAVVLLSSFGSKFGKLVRFFHFLEDHSEPVPTAGLLICRAT